MVRFFKLFWAVCAVAGLLVLLVSFTPLVSWLARDIADDWYEGDADVLVVLGGSMLVDGRGPQGTMGWDSYLRCVYASWALKQHRYRYVVTSGPDGLGEAMARYLALQGTDAKTLLIEGAARTTTENAEFVKKILDRQAGVPAHPLIAVLTSDYHTRRARLVFAHAGMPVRMIPVPDLAKRDSSVGSRWTAFLDLVSEFAKTAGYKVRGRI